MHARRLLQHERARWNHSVDVIGGLLTVVTCTNQAIPSDTPENHG